MMADAPTMAPAAETLRRIERLNYLFGAALVVGAVALTNKAFVGGVMIGVAVTCLNFAVMRALGSGLTRHVAAGGSPGKAIILLPKTIALMAIVGLSLWLLPIDPLGFVMGFSIILLSITTEAVRSILRPPTTTSPDEQHHG